MENIFLNSLCVASYSYLLGCFCTAYYLVKYSKKQDIRKIHSGNAGARNASRVLGAKGFIITFLGDFLKSVLALAITIKLFELNQNFPILLSVSMISVIIGHIFPIQLKFMGGKGIAPFTGIIFIINLPTLIFSLISLFILLKITKNQKLSIGVSILLIIPACFFFLNYCPLFLDRITIIAINIAIILIIYSHIKKTKNADI
jgi:glycerol-3-phosphate acyltransferase PlsY